jgi:hypothetical protein
METIEVPNERRLSGSVSGGRVFIGPNRRGVLEIKGNEVVPLLSMDQLGGANLLSIECEPDGGYFAATSSGLVRWKDGRLTTLGAESNAYIAKHIITDLAQAARWIALRWAPTRAGWCWWLLTLPPFGY